MWSRKLLMSVAIVSLWKYGTFNAVVVNAHAETRGGNYISSLLSILSQNSVASLHAARSKLRSRCKNYASSWHACLSFGTCVSEIVRSALIILYIRSRHLISMVVSSVHSAGIFLCLSFSSR